MRTIVCIVSGSMKHTEVTAVLSLGLIEAPIWWNNDESDKWHRCYYQYILKLYFQSNRSFCSSVRDRPIQTTFIIAFGGDTGRKINHHTQFKWTDEWTCLFCCRTKCEWRAKFGRMEINMKMRLYKKSIKLLVKLRAKKKKRERCHCQLSLLNRW